MKYFLTQNAIKMNTHAQIQQTVIQQTLKVHLLNVYSSGAPQSPEAIDWYLMNNKCYFKTAKNLDVFKLLDSQLSNMEDRKFVSTCMFSEFTVRNVFNTT